MPEWVMRIGPYTLTFNRPDPPSAEEVQRLVDTNGELLAQMPLSYILSRGLSVPRTKLPNGEYVADVMKSRSPYEQYRYVQSLQKRTPAQEAFLVAYKKRVIDAGYEPFARDEWKYIYSRTKYAGNPELEAKRQALEKAFRSDAFLRGVAMQSRNLRLAREVENFEQRNRYALQLASQLSELDKNLRGGLRGIWTAYTQIVPSLPMAAVRAHEEAARNAARGGKLSIAEQAKYAGLGVAGTSAQMLLDPVMQLGAVGALVGVPALARGVKAATTAGMLARGAPAVEAGVAGQRAGAIASGLAHGGLGLGFGIPMMYHAWQALRQPTDLVSEKAGAFASGLMGAGMAAGGAVAGVRGMRAPAARPEAVFVARSTVESLRRGDRLAGELIGGGEPAVVRSVSDTSVEVVRRGPNHTLETKTIPKKQLVKRMAEVLDTGLMSVDELRVQRRQPTTRAEASPEAQPQPQPVPEQPPAQPAPEQRQSVAPEVVTQAAPDTQPVAPQPQPTPRMLPDVGTGDHPSISLAGIGEVRRGDTLSRVLFDGDSDVLVTRITDTHVIGSKTGGDGATVAIPLDVLEARVVAQLAPGMSTPEQLRVRPTEPPAEVPPQQSVSQPPVEPVAVPEPVRPTEPATPVQRQVAQSVPVLPVAQDVVPQPPPVEVAPAPVAPAPAPSPKPRRARGSKKAAEQPTAETPVAQPVPEAIPVEQPVKAAQAAQPPAEAPAPAKRRTSRGKKAAEPQVETAADAVAAQPAAPEPPVQASSPAAALREKAAEARAAAEELAQQQAQRGGVRGKGSRRSTGAVLGPEDIAMRIKEAALRIYAGTLDAAAWFSEMTHKYGEAVRPHLDRWWRRAQEIARAMRKREFGNQQEAEAFAADRARRTRKLPQVEYTEPQQGRMVNDPDVARALDEIAEAYGAEVLSAGRTRVTAELARREGVPWSGHAPEYKSMGEFMGAAKRRVDADPELPVRIAQRVQRASGGKPVTAEEQAALVYGMARSTSRLRELAREAERTTDPAQLRRLGDEMARERATLELLYEANAKVGTEAARAFNIRKLMVLADDRSVIINRMRAEAGRPLRPEEVARAEQLADELRRTRDELEQIRQANADAVRRAEEAQQRAEALRAEVLRLRRQAVSQGAVQPVQAPPSQAAQPASVRQTAQASRAVARAEARTEARVRRETVRAQRIAQLQAEREAAKQAMMDAFRTALRGTPPSAMGVGVFQGFTPEVLHQIAANAAKYAAAYVKETGLKVADAYDLLASEVSAQFNIALSGKELSSLVRKHKLLVRRAEALTQALERIRQQEEAGTLTGTASERILGKLNQVLTALNMKPVSADVTPQQLQRVRAKLREIASALSETPLDAEARASLAALEAEIAQFEAAEVVVTHMQRQRQALEQRRQRLQDAIDRQVRGEQTTEGGRRRRRAQEPEDIREARRQVRELEQELRDLQEFERAREPLRQTLEQLRQLRRDTSRPRAERYAEGRRIVEELVREYPVLRRAGREATQLLGQSPELIEAHMAHNAAVRAVEAELYRMRAPSLQQVLWEIFNCSRAIRQSFDLSAVGKQQAIVFLTHPFTASRQMMPMLRAMASQRAYERIQAHIASDPEIAQAVAAGLQITDVAPQAAALGIREEGFYSVYAEKIPGVLQSERAFIVMNNLVRSELWKLYSRAINARLQRRRGRTMNEDEMRDLAEWVNTISGRATFSERVQKRWGAVLGTVFWAPRLLLARSRLFNPAYFIKVARRSPEVGRVMFMEMAKLYAALSAIMIAAKYAGATVHDDPKDGRFGYITVGKTNIDLTGGARTVASLLFRTMNAIKEAHEQKLEGATRARKIFYPVSRFVRSKASPIGGILWDIYTGTTFEGEPVSAKAVLTSMAVPLSAVDAYEAYKAYAKEEHGLAKTVAASAAAVTGAANTRVWATRPTSGTRVRTRRARRRRPRAVMQVSF